MIKLRIRIIFKDKRTWNCGMLITEVSKRFMGDVDSWRCDT